MQSLAYGCVRDVKRGCMCACFGDVGASFFSLCPGHLGVSDVCSYFCIVLCSFSRYYPNM